MNYKDIISDIKNRNLKNIYLFYGKEYYLIENAIKEICRRTKDIRNGDYKKNKIKKR